MTLCPMLVWRSSSMCAGQRKAWVLRCPDNASYHVMHPGLGGSLVEGSGRQTVHASRCSVSVYLYLPYISLIIYSKLACEFVCMRNKAM